MSKSIEKIILENEGFEPSIYKDTAGVDTIGFGFTAMFLNGKNGKPSMDDYPNGMTEEEGYRILREYAIPEYENQIKSKVPNYDDLTQNQKDGLFDLTYRNGVGNISKSGIYKAAADNDFELVSKLVIESDYTNKQGGKVIKEGDKGYDGIKKRNTETASLFTTEEESPLQTYEPKTAGVSITGLTPPEDDDPYSDKNINAAVDKFVDWANSDNPEQAILDAVDKVNNEADKKRLQKAAENAIAQKERSKKVSNIKNKDNLDYLERRATAGAVELSDEDNTIIQNIAEEQRIQWSKLGKPGLLDLAKNALGMSQGDISVDDDAANAVMRRQVINSLSEDIDVNTASGKQLLRQRLKAYTDLIGSDEYKDKVETLTGGGIGDSSYENMIDDLSSDYQVFIVDANKIHNLEGNDAINYEIKSQEHLDKNLDNEGVLSDNKATIQNLIEEGNEDLANDVAERGLDAVAVDLANAQNEAAKRGETDATAKTLLALADKEAEMAVEKKSMDEGVSGLEAIDFGEVDEDEEEITTTFDEWKKNNPDGTLEDWQKEQKNTKNTSNNEAKISGAEKALTGLKAAAGILSLSQALRAPDVETPEISPLVTEALHKQKALAESGLTAKEKGAAMQNLNDAYAGAMKNVLRASGGQRGMFLANQGTVDANRIQGLNQLAAQDAALHRQNIGQYNQLASSVGSMKLSRDMNVEQMRQATLSNNRQILSGVGSNLLSDAISDVSYYMNPNREKTQALLDQLSKGQNADTSGFNKSVETANTDPTNQKQVDKSQVANQKKTDV